MAVYNNSYLGPLKEQFSVKALEVFYKETKLATECTLIIPIVLPFFFFNYSDD